DRLRLGQLAQGRDRAALGQREALPQLQRRRLVRHPERQYLGHQAPPPLLPPGARESDMDGSWLPRPGAAWSAAGAAVRDSAISATSRRSRSIRASFMPMIAT